MKKKFSPLYTNSPDLSVSPPIKNSYVTIIFNQCKPSRIEDNHLVVKFDNVLLVFHTHSKLASIYKLLFVYFFAYLCLGDLLRKVAILVFAVRF